MQLRLAIAVVVAAVPAAARADGELTIRGAYYKERATRVMQPMLDGLFGIGENGSLTAHFLVDAITSASVAAGADASAFTERRYEAGAGYTHQLPRDLKLGGHVRYSNEPDYNSLFVGARSELALAEKNFVLGVAGSYGHDDVTNAGAQGPFVEPIEGSLDTYLGSAQVSQLLSPVLVASLTYDVAYLKGFQQNPYRSAITDAGLVPEKHPEKRTRHAFAPSVRYFVRRTKTALVATYRYYFDDWDVRAHTPELRVVQEASDQVEFGVRYRYYRQTAAEFYAPRYRGDEMYFSDDVKLSDFSSHLFEGKLAVRGDLFGMGGRFADSRIEVLLQYVDQNNRFGNAIVAQAAFTLPFAY